MDWIEVKKEKQQIDNCIWVECIAEIRNNATGEVRECETHEILEVGDKHPYAFNWGQNNYACDCNRLLFFKKAKGEVIVEEDFQVECTDDKFSVNLKNKRDGVVYYREYDA